MFDMSLLLIKIIAISFFTISFTLVFFSLRNIKQEVPEDNREYMDPLPPKLKIIWPLVQVAAYYIGERLPVEKIEKYSKKLKRSGVDYLMTAEQLFGLQIVSGLLMSLIAYFAMSSLGEVDWLFVFIGGLLGFLMPDMTINDLKKKREKELIKELPAYLDFLTMAVQAGMNLSGAMTQAVDKSSESALRVEFQKILRDIKAGMSRLDALREMSERLDIREISSFVTAIAQSEKTGCSVGATLKVQADQRRIERFQKAEKLAMEAPVKLILPLVAFIFPMTFLLLAFPIVMKVMYEM